MHCSLHTPRYENGHEAPLEPKLGAGFMTSLGYRKCSEADHIRRDCSEHMEEQKKLDEERWVHGGAGLARAWRTDQGVKHVVVGTGEGRKRPRQAGLRTMPGKGALARTEGYCCPRLCIDAFVALKN